jgi:hypothetical protein
MADEGAGLPAIACGNVVLGLGESGRAGSGEFGLGGREVGIGGVLKVVDREALVRWES